MHGHALVGQREHLVRARARVRVRVRVSVRLRVRPGSVSAWWGWLTPALAMVTEWPSRWRMVREKPRRAWRSVRGGVRSGVRGGGDGKGEGEGAGEVRVSEGQGQGWGKSGREKPRGVRGVGEVRLAEREAQHHREVGAVALEDAVRRGLELQVHVARHHARRLLRRALEADRRAW